jgi:hypothetical protein
MLQIVASTFSHLNLVSRGRDVYIRTPNSKPAVADCATITALNNHKCRLEHHQSFHQYLARPMLLVWNEDDEKCDPASTALLLPSH